MTSGRRNSWRGQPEHGMTHNSLTTTYGAGYDAYWHFDNARSPMFVTKDHDLNVQAKAYRANGERPMVDFLRSKVYGNRG